MDASYIALATALGTPLVAFLIYLFNRRATLRGTNATTDATYIATAGELVNTLQGQIDKLIARQTEITEELRIERINFTTQLNLAHAENARVNGVVAQLQTDSDIAQRQIRALRNYLPDQLPDATKMLFDG